MPTRLDLLLEAIHPDRTRKVIERRADEALISFRVETNRIVDGIRFHDIICDFVRHLNHHFRLFPVEVTIPNGMAWQLAVELFRKAYGSHGDAAAFEIARSAGLEGGLSTVLKQMAQHRADELVEQEIEARVEAYCRSLGANDYLAAGSEYIENYGHLLPEEMKRGFAGRARVNLPQLLQQHHRARDLTSRVGQYLP